MRPLPNWVIYFIFVQLFFSVPMIWSGIVALKGGLQKRRIYPAVRQRTRFAVVICAKDEEKVIGRLLGALQEQDYPADCIHTYVIADHCTDHTAKIARRFKNVSVYERFAGPTGGKGDVLNWGIQRILLDHGKEFDAFAFFDADNIPAKDFLSRMNEYLAGGEKIVQGHRIAGDLASGRQTMVTEWFKTYWLFFSSLFLYMRQKLHLSCFLTGTGFVAAKEVLAHGWNTSTITEDVEFATTSCARGYRVAFALEAVCYDEQPSSFCVMIRQLNRWCTGAYQILPHYFGLWVNGLRHPVKKPEYTLKITDNLMMLLMGPAGGLGSVVGLVLGIFWVSTHPVMTVLFTAVGVVLMAVGIRFFLTKFYHLKDMKGMYPGYLLFGVFLTCYSLCSLRSCFFPATQWKRIEHRGISIEENS